MLKFVFNDLKVNYYNVNCISFGGLKMYYYVVYVCLVLNFVNFFLFCFVFFYGWKNVCFVELIMKVYLYFKYFDLKI